jgi:hypothetical protein
MPMIAITTKTGTMQISISVAPKIILSHSAISSSLTGVSSKYFLQYRHVADSIFIDFLQNLHFLCVYLLSIEKKTGTSSVINTTIPNITHNIRSQQKLAIIPSY